MSNLMGKYALVTGAGKGIGKAIVARFLADGCAGVALMDYDAQLVDAAAKELDPSGQKTLVYSCDVADAAKVATAVQDIVAKWGQIDILVNNAGITRDKIFHKMDRATWDAVVDVNLNGPFNLCHEVYPVMREKGYGRIINISSTSAFGNAGQANYSATKSALLGFTKTLAREGASKNIVANVIAPGYIDTDMFQAVPDDILETYKTHIPMRRFGQPEEIASVCSFLASDDVSFMSGQCLIVSGAAQT